jgi:hypothetical protein
MVYSEIPECPECGSTEVVVHKRDVVAADDTPRTVVSGYE